jgi:excisionase family DNA binding protein
MFDQIVTINEVADYLRVNERTVYRMASAGKIPAFKVGGAWRIKLSELEEWIKDQSNINSGN